MKYMDAQGQVRTLVAEQRPFKGVENYFTDALLYQDVHEVVAQHKKELELSNITDRESVSNSDHGSKEWELNLHALEALEMSDEPPQTTLSEDEPDCSWEFDASTLECLETSTFDDLCLDEYMPAYSDYSFRDEAAESLLLSHL